MTPLTPLTDDGLTPMQRSRWRELYPLTTESFDAYMAANPDDWPTFEGLVHYAVDQGRDKHETSSPLPDGTYRTIVIDPPWPMKKLPRRVHPEQGKTLDYPTLSVDEIAALPIEWHATAGTHLYLWTTQRFLPDTFGIVEGWGFRYHCLLTWVKNGGFTPFTWMLNAEHVVFAYKPPLEIARKGLKIAFEADRTGHSTKPDRFYELVEQASHEPRLEMFARTRRPGWTAWGDEVG